MRQGIERSKCDCILLFCENLNMYWSNGLGFLLYEIKMENPPKKLGIFFWNWERTYSLALGMGPNFGPKIG